MELILEQIAALNTKVDALYGIVDQLNQTVVGIAPALETLGTEGLLRSDMAPGTYQGGYRQSSRMDGTLEHKDVLVESPYPEQDSHSADSISPEVQTQRLTAQLTAAYNRIAALEEQLLSQRITH